MPSIPKAKTPAGEHTIPVSPGTVRRLTRPGLRLDLPPRLTSTQGRGISD